MESPPLKDVLQKALTEKGWTRQQFLEELAAHGKSRTEAAVSYWLTGKNRPDGDVIPLLSDLLGVDRLVLWEAPVLGKNGGTPPDPSAPLDVASSTPSEAGEAA